MTEQEELRYLISLTLSASEWRVSEDQADVDPLRLEITHRLETLQGIEPEVVDGRIYNKPVDKEETTYQQDVDNPEPAGMVQISMPKKKKKWVRLDWTELVPCKCSHTGFKRVVKEEYRHLVPGLEPVPDVDAPVAG